MIREIPGLGAHDYGALEDELARSLLRSDAPTRHNEVAVLHALYVELDARPAEDDSWTSEALAIRDRFMQRTLA